METFGEFALPVFLSIYNPGYAANLSTNLPLNVSPINISLIFPLTRNAPLMLSAVCSAQPLRTSLLTLTNSPEVASGHSTYTFGEVVNNLQVWLKSDDPKGYNTVRTHGGYPDNNENIRFVFWEVTRWVHHFARRNSKTDHPNK